MTGDADSGAARYAAFLRNINLGRPLAPSRAQLEAAFLESGAASASSFLVNGTLVFTVMPGERPRAVAARACAAMRASCGMREPVFVCSVAELQALVASDPFAGVVAEGRDACCLTLLGASRQPLPALPFVTARRDVELLQAGASHVLSVSRWFGKSGGSPNAVLERLLGEPATTRNWRTVVRLVEKFGRPKGSGISSDRAEALSSAAPPTAIRGNA